ncbi:ABC transporter permease [Streptomyces sp. NPDC090025]|uniref:ABC transporter permease n=1 Tax=Streptomyces sp. NPDC090025 TaxID=3365922 RepID=UPI0038354811
MSTPTTTPATTATTTATTAGTTRAQVTGAAARLRALGRAEFTLLLRNRSALFVAVLLPVLMVGSIRSSLAEVDLSDIGLSAAGAAVTGGIGMALLMVVHANLVAAFVARREGLVLKRLRTGEPRDLEILTGIALPAAALTVAQCVLLSVGGVTVLGLGAPTRPLLLIAGVLLGIVLLTAIAAATSAVTRTVESAQLTTLPLLLVSIFGSGLFFPISILPDRIAALCELLPLTGVMTLVRAGWSGTVEPADLALAALAAVVWIALSAYAVRRWFRWDPRR